MGLPRIDLGAMERVARDMVNRQLSDYLCDTMAAVLPRVPTAPEYVPHLVAMAGELACASGYEHGRAYSVYVMICFLLGPGWEHDPNEDLIPRVLADPGMDAHTRINLALSKATLRRIRLEAMLPQMLARIEAVLARDDTTTMEHVWRVFQELASLRGVVDDERVLDLLEIYEADAFRLLRLAPLRRKRLTAADRRVYAHINWPLPQPTDEYRALEPQTCLWLGRHLLLAVTYGRDFYRNPLLLPLRRILAETATPSQQTPALQAFLQRHRHALTEAFDDR